MIYINIIITKYLIMTPKKSTSFNILKQIFNTLKSCKEPVTIKDISENTGIYHSTIKHYLDMIEFIQSQSKIIIKPTGSSYQISLQEST